MQARSLVAVVGASGSGKSSLVFAGLQPRLKAEGWLVEDCRPGSQPFYGLAEAFMRLLEPDLSASQLVKPASDLSALIQQRGIGEVVASLTHKYAGRSLLIIVDQFEELFTLCETEQRESFLKVLLDGLTKAVGLKLVVTLRADFCGQAYGDRTLTDAFQDAQLLVGPMNSEELQTAIEQPAKQQGLELESGLTDRLLQDVGQEPGNLPLLEFALTQLWERQERGRLTHQAYTEIQGVKGALAKHANEVFARLTKEQQQQAPQVFTKLVRLGVGTEDTRKVATRSQVGNWELVTILANQRLVVTGRDEQRQEDTVEVIHEALIREWKPLQQWVDENRNLRQLMQTVEDARQIWLVEKKRKDLLEGRLLKDAKRLLKKRVDVPGEVRSFVRQSLRWRRLQFAGLMLIPVLVLGVPVEHFWREESVKRDYDRIQRLQGPVDREAVLNRAGGCWAKTQYPWVPEYLKEYLKERQFGNCRSLEDAKLEKADLRGMNLSGVELSHAKLSGAILASTNLNYAELSFTDLSEADFENASLMGTRLAGAYSLGTNFNSANLSGANLDSAILTCVAYNISDLRCAALNNANLSNADLTNAFLMGADLSLANLSGANLTATDLSGADLRSANLTNVKFKCTKYPDQKCPDLKDIKWNEKTEWAGIQGWETVQNIPPALKRKIQTSTTNLNVKPSNPNGSTCFGYTDIDGKLHECQN